MFASILYSWCHCYSITFLLGANVNTAIIIKINGICKTSYYMDIRTIIIAMYLVVIVLPTMYEKNKVTRQV